MRAPRFEKNAAKFVQNELQLSVAQQAAEHAGAKSAAIRYAFIARDEASDPSPPLARMLRGSGGRGGAVRLKLYLTILWLARGRQDPVFAYPAQQYAALLGLPSPEQAGARRIHDALSWLEEQGFVALDRRRGDTTRVHLLDDAGSGRPYRAPGPLAKAQNKRPQREREKHFYVQLDRAYWTGGWITVLPGNTIAMFLIALHEQRGRAGESFWISPRIGRERYDLSDETRQRGLRSLIDYGLLDLERRPLPQASFDESYRARNSYRIPPEAFTHRVTGKLRSAQAVDDLFS